MKIGFDVSILAKDLSGIGQYVSHMIQNMMHIEDSKQHDFYLFTHDELKLPLTLPDNWHLVFYGGPKHKQMRYLTRMHRYLKQHGIDIFVGTRPCLPLFRPGNTQYAVVVHDLIPLFMPQYFTKSFSLRFKLFTKICRRNSDTFIAVSEATRRDIRTYMNVPDDKIHVIYEGASTSIRPMDDCPEMADTMAKYHIDAPYLLCLATVEPRKNMLRTIQAYEQCLSGDFPYKLVIVGGRGWNNGDIYEYVQQHGNLKDHVIFTGYATDEEVTHIYANASLFVYASLYEGFGLPVLEAMQSGVPVITSDVSSLPEVAGDACLLIDPYNVEQIRDAIMQVISSPELQQQMIQDGLQQARKFSWEKCAAETYQLITSLV